MTPSSNPHRAAFSLTELAIVLAVVGVLIGAIWTAAVNAKNNSRATTTAKDILQLVANVRSTYMGVSGFSTAGLVDEIANGNFISAGIIPTDILTGSKTVENAYGGSVSVWENNTHPTGYVSSRVFRVSFYGTPSDACVRIASQLVNLGTNDGPIGLTTGCGAMACGTTQPACGADGGPPILHTGAPTGLTETQINTVCAANNTAACKSTEFDFEIH